MSTEALLSSESNEHYSPPSIVEPARVALGGTIDFDPFSCALANTIVRATSFYSAEQAPSGFAAAWHGNVLCNPPGGKLSGESQQVLAWVKLLSEVKIGRVQSAIFVCFNLGFLQVSQGAPPPLPLDYPICYPSSRVAYLVDRLPAPTPKQPKRKPTAKQLADFAATGLCEGDSPPGASCIVYVGAEVERFATAFDPIGHVVVPNGRKPSEAPTFADFERRENLRGRP